MEKVILQHFAITIINRIWFLNFSFQITKIFFSGAQFFLNATKKNYDIFEVESLFFFLAPKSFLGATKIDHHFLGARKKGIFDNGEN